MKRIDTPALLVRSVPYGEADLVATFFTASEGKLAAIVRGARRSSKRFAGALEPIHELFVTLEDKGRELCTLKEARIARARTRIVADLDTMEAAGRALRWVRHLCPARTPEPAAWRSLAELLDRLDEADEPDGPRASASAALAVFGLRLLADVGYGLDLDRCVRCGRPCPEGRSAFVDAGGGGLVCTSCGGARRTIPGGLRAIAARAQRGDPGIRPKGGPQIENPGIRPKGGLQNENPSAVLNPEEAGELLAIVEEAMAAHTDFDAHKNS